MNELFMGVDAGTQGVRIVISDALGMVISSGERKWDTIYPDIGCAEQEPEVWWNLMLEAIDDCVSGLSREERDNLSACSVCATSSTVIPVSEDGTPLMRALMWMDSRSQEEAESVNSIKHPILEFCGGAVSPEWLIPKVLWLKKNRFDLYKKAFFIVEQLDWINFQLSGKWVASKCNASCKWNYCDSLGGFVEEFYKEIGMEDYEQKIITNVKCVGEEIGSIRSDLAKRFGINPEMKIIQGGIDAHIALIGMNAFQEGRMGIIMGSSFVHLSQTAKRPKNIKGIWGPYDSPLQDGMWLLEGGQITASVLIAWFQRNFNIQISDRNEDVYSVLDSAVREIPIGSEGLVVLDFFQGNRTPYKDPKAKGIIYGLNIKHTWKHIYRSILEAVAFATKNIIDNQESQGYYVDHIVACGGVNKNEYWMQMISDVIGKRIRVNMHSEAGAMGCCVIGAAGAGRYESFELAADAMINTRKEYLPNMELHEIYKKSYRKYLSLYESLKKEMK